MREPYRSIAKLFCAAIFVTLVGCEERSADSRSVANPAYERVLQTKTIRVGYISYPPSLIKDPNSKQITGIFHDVLQEIGRRADLKIEFVEEVGWGTMIAAVNSGRVDLICTGLWPNSTRAKFADFTNPIYFSPIKTYVKADDKTFDGDLSKVNEVGIRIASIDGEMSSIIAETDFSKATVHALPQATDVSQLLLEVAGGKAALTFVEPAIAEKFLEKNPGSVREVANVAPVRVFPNVMMVSKGETKLIAMLNVAIDELANTGFVDQVVARYEEFPGSFYQRALPYRLPGQ